MHWISQILPGKTHHDTRASHAITPRIMALVDLDDHLSWWMPDWFPGLDHGLALSHARVRAFRIDGVFHVAHDVADGHSHDLVDRHDDASHACVVVVWFFETNDPASPRSFWTVGRRSMGIVLDHHPWFI
jgi:hypothetical protein